MIRAHSCVRSACALVLGAALLITPSAATATAGEAAAQLLLRVGVIRMLFPNLRDRSEWASGALEPGEGTRYSERFERGIYYVITAVGCGNAADIDLAVIDDEGNVVAIDEKPDAEPTVQFVPEYTGRYRTVVYMSKTRNGEAAHFAYQVFFVDRPRER